MSVGPLRPKPSPFESKVHPTNPVDILLNTKNQETVSLAPKRNLSLGMKGEDVLQLQRELGNLGFVIPENEIREKSFGPGTKNAVKKFQQDHPTGTGTDTSDGVADEPTVDLILREIRIYKPYLVQGTVIQPSGIPLADIIVRVLDKDLRKDRTLGEQVTDSHGNYIIRYSSEQFDQNGRSSPNLVFELFDKTTMKPVMNFTAIDESGRLLSTLDFSEKREGKQHGMYIKYNAAAEQRVYFVVTIDLKQSSEYNEIIKKLEPHLLNVLVTGPTTVTLVDKIADIKNNEIEFLSIQAGIELEKIELLIASTRLHKKATEQQLNVSPEALYGLARVRGVSDTAGLARTSIADLQTALTQAGGQKKNFEEDGSSIIIPPFESEERLNEQVNLIHRFATESVLRSEPHVEGKPTLPQILVSALPSPNQQATLLHEFSSHKGTIKDFWNSIRQHPEFKEDPSKIKKVQFTLQLGALTQNNLPLIAMMQNRFKSTREMARSGEEEIRNFIKQASFDLPPEIPGSTKEEKLDLYTKSIVGILQGAFPTETVANMISKIAEGHFSNVKPSAVSGFLKGITDTRVIPSGEEFDIRSTHIDSFISKYTDKIFAGLDNVDKDNLIEQVKRIQRLFQVSTSPETFQVLVESKFNSANEIAQMSLPSLKEEFRSRIDPVELELMHQRSTAATAANLYLALQVYQSLTDVHPMVVGSGGLKELPNWARLFGSLEMCDCEHCGSVYSPAAYFVDLLEFLGKSSKNELGWTPLDVLIGNYQDPNPTNQLSGKRPDLAYIPLTCENTNTRIPYIDLANEVLESYITLGGYLDQTTAKDTGNSTADELGANPQYVEELSYDKLREAIFPIDLPFDRALDIVRLYLDHLGVSRYDIMHAFDVNGNKRSGEYLGLTEKEFEILTGTNYDGQPSLLNLNDLYIYRDENLNPTLEFNPTFTAEQIMSGSAVVILQAKLNTDGANPALSLNGKYNSITEIAVRAFQQKHSLPVNGIVDTDDWAVLSTIKPDTAGALVTGVLELLHRTKLSYIELVEVLKTRYLNPNQQALLKLESTGITYKESTGITYKEIRTLIRSNFTNPDQHILDKLADAGLSLSSVRQLIERHLRLIVLFSEKSDCDLSTTLIQYLNGNSLDNNDLWKFQRFIRLWQRLGWKIPEVDAALVSLDYTDEINGESVQKLAQIKELQLKLKLPVVKLLSLWANIDYRQDEDSLYKRLFLNRATLKMDSAFQPKPDGSVLDGSQTISAHVETLLAAFQMSAVDLAAVRTDAGLVGDDVRLTLSNVSALYRYAVLSKALKLKIKDMIAIKILAGLDPFTPKTPSSTISFIEVVREVKASDFSIAHLNYIYSHLWQPGLSPTPPSQQEIALLVNNLQNNLQKIALDNTLQISDSVSELTRNKLATILNPTIADEAIQMILDTASTRVASLDKLPDGITFDQSVKNKVSYDQTTKKLQFSGLMFQGEYTLLTNASADTHYRNAVNQLFQQSTTFVQQFEAFINKNLSDFLDLSDARTHLLISSIDVEGKPSTIDHKFNYILKRLLPYLQDKFGRSLIKQTISESLKLDGTVIQVLLESILKARTDPTKPVITDFLSLVGDGLSAAYFNNATLTGTPAVNRVDSRISFTGDTGRSFPDPLINQPLYSIRWTGKLLAQYSETYTFYLSANGGSFRLWIDNQNIEHLGTIDLRAGQLYEIKAEYVKTDTNVDAVVELQWSSSSTTRNVISQNQLYSDSTFFSFDLPLKSYYLLHKIAMLINGLQITAEELTYLSDHPEDFAGIDPADPTQKVPFDLNSIPLDSSLFKPAFFNQWLRLARLFSFKESLPNSEISMIDVFEFATTNADKSKMNRDIVKQLQTTVNQNSSFTDLLANWAGISQVTLKQVLSNDWTGLSETVIKSLISDPSQLLNSSANFVNLLAKLTDLQILTMLLTAITGWEIKDLNSLIGAQGLNMTLAEFKNEGSLLKLHTCMKLIRRLGISALKLFAWVTQRPDALQAQDVKNTVKAKYDDETWLTVARPLSDKIRRDQKAALIAYILTMPEVRRANIKDSNQLFEYFLIDVEMDPCMATSRIKQAISSIQLFVQRCLLNLEPGIRPSAIDNVRWEWMKNYRIWEANRKVFLYAENWIEPELRDDKSPFFKEFESELLQDDLTNQVAERALINYLYKLDDVARLEICGMYLQEESEQGEIDYQNILHVFARTMGGAKRNYYYRRLINNRTWTPWEKVELDIQGIQGSDDQFPSGVDLLPVVWNRRLYLFWLILTKKAQKPLVPHEIDPANEKVKLTQAKEYWDITLAWSKYDQGKWSPKQVSEEKLQRDYWFILNAGGLIFLRSNPPHLFKLKAKTSDEGLELHVILGSYGKGIRIGKYSIDDYHGKISASLEDDVKDIFDVSPLSGSPYFMGYNNPNRSNLTLTISEDATVPRVPIFDNAPPYMLLPLNQYYKSPYVSLASPYFYQDAEHVYFVRSRQDFEYIVELVENPDMVSIPDLPDISAGFIPPHLDPEPPPIPDYIMEKAVVNPWVSAERWLGPQKRHKIRDQSGVRAII